MQPGIATSVRQSARGAIRLARDETLLTAVFGKYVGAEHAGVLGHPWLAARRAHGRAAGRAALLRLLRPHGGSAGRRAALRRTTTARANSIRPPTQRTQAPYSSHHYDHTALMCLCFSNKFLINYATHMLMILQHFENTLPELITPKK